MIKNWIKMENIYENLFKQERPRVEMKDNRRKYLSWQRVAVTGINMAISKLQLRIYALYVTILNYSHNL